MSGRVTLRGLVMAGTLLVSTAGLAQVDIEDGGAGSLAGPNGPVFGTYEIQTGPYVAVAPVIGAPAARAVPVAVAPDRRADRERELIARLGITAHRSGSVLTLGLDDGKVIRFVDQPGPCAGFLTCLSHRLDDYVADRGYYVVSVDHGEGGWAYMVRRSDGDVTGVVAPPVLARDGSFAIAWSPSLMDGPKLDMVRFASTGLEIEPAIVEGSCWPRLAEADATWVPFAMDASTVVWTRTVGSAWEALPGIALSRIDGHWQLVCEG